MIIPKERRSLLSSQCRVQAPYIKVQIGSYTFGVFQKTLKNTIKDPNGFYQTYKVKYPNYVQSLHIVKINGQVNQYTLNISYPVTPTDDPNFFEKVFSSVSKTRKIVFTYGDASMPSYIYKDEEAIITKVTSRFNFGSSGSNSAVISYDVSAVSGAALGKTGCYTFIGGLKKPSDEIKRIFQIKDYGLQNLFTGMKVADLDSFIPGDDKIVEITTQTNISALDYITYLTSCMIPAGSTQTDISKDIYILTVHDDTIYDKDFIDTHYAKGGPYFKIERTTYKSKYTDAYEVDIGFNSNVIVSNFQLNNNENYSIYYNYQKELYPEEYVRRIGNDGKWEEVFAPTTTSKNNRYKTTAEDITWFTKLAKYPVSGSITINGLLRPALLMQYLRVHVLFPGTKDSEVIGHYNSREHISSGLYLITKQEDAISGDGYKTTLQIQKISG